MTMYVLFKKTQSYMCFVAQRNVATTQLACRMFRL